MKLGVVVVYSSIDRFLWDKLRLQIETIADSAVVVRRTHLWSGEVEPLDPMGLPTITMPMAGSDPWVAIQDMRIAGVEDLSPDTTHVLLLDSDELFEIDRLKEAITDVPTYFAANWYWRSGSCIGVQQKETAGLLCKPDLLFRARKGDRENMAASIERPRPRIPFMHHYSWCKPLDCMLSKVRSWGHRDDRQWVDLVTREWASALPGTCFVHKNRPLATCTDMFDIGTP